jgi:hypothetical protein
MTAMRRLVMGSIDFMSLTISPGVLYFASESSESARRVKSSYIRRLQVDSMFEVFKDLPDGNFLRIAAVRDLQEAKRHVDRLALIEPGRYLIHCQQRGFVVEHVSEPDSDTAGLRSAQTRSEEQGDCRDNLHELFSRFGQLES